MSKEYWRFYFSNKKYTTLIYYTMIGEIKKMVFWKIIGKFITETIHEKK